MAKGFEKAGWCTNSKTHLPLYITHIYTYIYICIYDDTYIIIYIYIYNIIYTAYPSFLCRCFFADFFCSSIIHQPGDGTPWHPRLSTIPTPKDFKDAIESLSREQQQFAKVTPSRRGRDPCEKFHRVREPGVIFQGIKTQPTQIFGTKKQANNNYIKKDLRMCDFDIC